MNTIPIADQLTEVAPLTMIDCHLVDLEAASRLLAHLSTTDLEIQAAELNAVVIMLDNAQAGIEACYNRARELYQAQREAHSATLADTEAALDEAKADAAPGSPADIKHAETIWSMLRAFVAVAADECDKARGMIDPADNTNT